jgi:hypothetical protein
VNPGDLRSWRRANFRSLSIPRIRLQIMLQVIRHNRTVLTYRDSIDGIEISVLGMSTRENIVRNRTLFILLASTAMDLLPAPAGQESR